MSAQIETLRKFEQLRQEGKVDAAVELLTDDVSVTMPMLGTTSGKEAVKAFWERAGARGGGFQISWSEPTEEGDKVKMSASTMMGPLTMVISFRGEKICKIEVERG